MVYTDVLSAPMTGDELKAKRQKLGMTQEELAQELGTTSNTVARWERGVVFNGQSLPRWVDKMLAQIESSKKKNELRS